MVQQEPDDRKKLMYEIYLRERESLIDAKREMSRFFDKAILTLAAGALGLSLAFMNQVAYPIRPGTLWILICAWSSFCLSLVSTLISFLVSQSACSRGIEILRARYLDEPEEPPGTRPGENRPQTWTWALNDVSAVAFVVGGVLLVVFAALNLAS